jgi:hypothetical protein
MRGERGLLVLSKVQLQPHFGLEPVAVHGEKRDSLADAGRRAFFEAGALVL